jgi:hypothetical protein
VRLWFDLRSSSTTYRTSEKRSRRRTRAHRTRHLGTYPFDRPLTWFADTDPPTAHLRHHQSSRPGSAGHRCPLGLPAGDRRRASVMHAQPR